MFGTLCSDEAKDSVRDELQIEKEAFDEKYLGLPTPEGCMKKDKFQLIRSRFGKRLADWSDKNVSLAGKEVLIKSVAQALPTYIMSVFKLPKGLCDDLMRMIRLYWWGAEEGKRKTQWISWKNLVQPKCRGGMGFRDFQLFNQAMLARQAWRLLFYPNSLCSRLLKAKYFPNGNLLDTVFTGKRFKYLARN